MLNFWYSGGGEGGECRYAVLCWLDIRTVGRLATRLPAGGVFEGGSG